MKLATITGGERPTLGLVDDELRVHDLQGVLGDTSLLEVIEHIERLTLEKQRAVTIPLLRQALRVAEDES